MAGREKRREKRRKRRTAVEPRPDTISLSPICQHGRINPIESQRVAANKRETDAGLMPASSAAVNRFDVIKV